MLSASRTRPTTHLLRPSLDGERPETRREPSVENILILLEHKGLTGELLLGALLRLLLVATDNPELSRKALSVMNRCIISILASSGSLLVSFEVPTSERAQSVKTHVLLLALHLDKVSGGPVSPPQLPRDAPIVDGLEPAVPLVLGGLGSNLEFAGAGALCVELPKKGSYKGERK